MTEEHASTAEEEKLLPSPKSVYGIDLGTTNVWNDYMIEVWKEMLSDTRCHFTKVIDDNIVGIRSVISLFSEAATILDCEFIRIHNNPSVFNDHDRFPFLMQTLDIKVRPFTTAFMNKVWKSTTTIEVLGKFLVHLKSVLEIQRGESIRNVVFTVPVSFSRLQLTWIKQACRMADLKVVGMMPQPTAVALRYACREQLAEGEKIALIFNMDSGYCDVAVISTIKGKCQIKALTGSAIGGEDLIDNMIDCLFPVSENIFNKSIIRNDIELTSMVHLRARVWKALDQLSSRTSVIVNLNLDCGNGLRLYSAVLTQREFEEVNKEVFEKCERLILQCLLDAKVEVEDIDDVIIVGGCSHIPKVKNLVTKICKRKEFYQSVDVLDGARCGAAMTGVIASGYSNVFGNTELLNFHFAPFSIGIRANGNNFTSVIPRNASLPTRRGKIFTTIHDNQTEALIVIYEGEAQRAEENHLLGDFKVTEIPRAPKGYPSIRLYMKIDNNNRLTVITWVGVLHEQYRKETIFEDEELGECDESLIRNYGDTIDVVTLFDREQ